MKFVCLFLLIIFMGKINAQSICLLNADNFESEIDGNKVCLFTLKNKNGCVAQFTNYGARWLSLWCVDKDGKWGDILLGFDSLSGYLNAAESYHGAIVGRVCGRIGNATFHLNGKVYNLAANDVLGGSSRNHLHGGVNGFHKKVWIGCEGVDSLGNNYVQFRYLSKDKEEGYPGNLNVTVCYTLKNDDTMRIDYWAQTDVPTLVNLTNHAFFNLSANPTQPVLNNIIQLNSIEYVECDKNLIPTGRILSLEDSLFNYIRPIPIGFPEIIGDNGIATSFVLRKKCDFVNDDFLLFALKLKDPITRRTLSIFTNQPIIQLYNAWLMDGEDLGKNSIAYEANAGLALETQGYPDAPNHSNFSDIEIYPHELYHHVTEYKFGVE